MSEKIIGYVLLAAGVFVILFSLLNVFMLLSNRTEPVKMFNFESVSIDASQFLGGDLSPEERAIVQQQMGESQIDLLPADVLNESSNLIAHVILMGLMATIGYRLGMLGVYMLRTIEIPVRKPIENKQ